MRASGVGILNRTPRSGDLGRKIEVDFWKVLSGEFFGGRWGAKKRLRRFWLVVVAQPQYSPEPRRPFHF